MVETGADVDTPLDQLQIQLAQRRAAEARAEAAMLVETIEERALEVRAHHVSRIVYGAASGNVSRKIDPCG